MSILGTDPFSGEFRYSKNFTAISITRMNEIRLNRLSYEEFGKLRFLSFFPRTADYYIDDSGGFECPIGLANLKGYGPTCFISLPKPSHQTVGIDLDFENGCPEVAGNLLLERLGLDLRKGMSYKQVREALGRPEREDFKGFPRFVVGTMWPYFVACTITKESGLCRVSIYRKDLADKEIRRLKQSE